MKNKIFGSIAMICAATLSLSGCAVFRSGEKTYSQSYWDGYQANKDVPLETIDNYGGAQAYCESTAYLEDSYTSSQQSDYIEGCLYALDEATGSTAENYDDLLSRLQSVGGDSWFEDQVNLFNAPAGFRTAYLARNGECTLWVFDDGDTADSAANGGFLDNFTEYGYSWGTDGSGLGVIAMYTDQYSPCADDMLETIGWGAWPE